MFTKTTLSDKDVRNIWFQLLGTLNKGETVLTKETVSQSPMLGVVERTEWVLNRNLGKMEQVVIVRCLDGVSRWFYTRNIDRIV